MKLHSRGKSSECSLDAGGGQDKVDMGRRNVLLKGRVIKQQWRLKRMENRMIGSQRAGKKKTKKEWARVMTELSLFIVGKQTCCKGYTTSSNTQEWKQMDEYRSSLLILCLTLTLSGPNYVLCC